MDRGHADTESSFVNLVSDFVKAPAKPPPSAGQPSESPPPPPSGTSAAGPLAPSLGFVADKVEFYKAQESKHAGGSIDTSRGAKPEVNDPESSGAAAGVNRSSIPSSAEAGTGGQACEDSQPPGVNSTEPAPPSAAATGGGHAELRAPPLAGADATSGSGMPPSNLPMKLPALWPDDSDMSREAVPQTAAQPSGTSGVEPSSQEHAPPVTTTGPSLAAASSLRQVQTVSPAGDRAANPQVDTFLEPPAHSHAPPAPAQQAPEGSVSTHKTGTAADSPQDHAGKAPVRAEGAGAAAEAPDSGGGERSSTVETPEPLTAGTDPKDNAATANGSRPGGQTRAAPPSPQGKRQQPAGSLPRASSGDPPKSRGRSPSQDHSLGSATSALASRSPGAKKITVPQPFQLATDRRATGSRGGAAAVAAAAAASPSPKASSPGHIRASLESPKIPPKPAPKPTTSPEPFNLESVKRHQEAQERLRAELEAKEKAERELHRFKAQPVAPPSPITAPKSTPPTAAEGFRFSSDVRAERRRVKAGEKEVQQRQEAKDGLDDGGGKEEEPLDIKEYRKLLAFKASPLPSFYKEPAKAPELRKSPLPLTRAVSPKLGRRTKPPHADETAAKVPAPPASASSKAPDRKRAAPIKPPGNEPAEAAAAVARAAPSGGASAAPLSAPTPKVEDAAKGPHAANGIAG